MGVDYNKLVPLLIEAVRELDQRTEGLIFGSDEDVDSTALIAAKSDSAAEASEEDSNDTAAASDGAPGLEDSSIWRAVAQLGSKHMVTRRKNAELRERVDALERKLLGEKLAAAATITQTAGVSGAAKLRRG